MYTAELTIKLIRVNISPWFCLCTDMSLTEKIITEKYDSSQPHLPFFKEVVSKKLSAFDSPPKSCLVAANSGFQCTEITGSEAKVLPKEYFNEISLKLEAGDVTLEFSENVNVSGTITWYRNNDLVIKSRHNITILENTHIKNYGNGSITLIAGSGGDDVAATVNFADTSSIESNGMVEIYYNPIGQDCKYHNARDYDTYVTSEFLTSYMWVHNKVDLQNIRCFLHGNYALSQDIDLSDAKFVPIYRKSLLSERLIPFSGKLNGNNHVISNFDIAYPDKDNVGLFRFCAGSEHVPTKIYDIEFLHASVSGHYRVGIVCGKSQHAQFENIRIVDPNVHGSFLYGVIAGSSILSDIKNISVVEKNDNNLCVVGGALSSSFYFDKSFPSCIIGEDAEENKVFDEL